MQKIKINKRIKTILIIVGFVIVFVGSCIAEKVRLQTSDLTRAEYNENIR